MKKKGAASAARLACALAGAIIVIAGCHKVTGGGWIAGVNGGKATFGFQAQCVDDEFGDPSQFEGQFQFNDRGAGVRFHGDVNANQTYVGAPEEWSCSDIVELVFPAELNQALFQGECTSPGGITGTFSVEVTDNGTPGSMAGDVITVSTPYTVVTEFGTFTFGEPCTDDLQPYSNSGVIGGGNLVSHGHKDADPGARKKG